jgi:hypothetical protein
LEFSETRLILLKSPIHKSSLIISVGNLDDLVHIFGRSVQEGGASVADNLLGALVLVASDAKAVDSELPKNGGFLNTDS